MTLSSPMYPSAKVVSFYPVSFCSYKKRVVYSVLLNNSCVSLTETTVTNSVNIHGILSASNSWLSNLTVRGIPFLKGCTIMGASWISGDLQAISSVFHQSVSLTTNETTFDASTIEGDLVVKPFQSEVLPVIHLMNTVIQGTVFFKKSSRDTSPAGFLYESGDSFFNDVSNGIVQEEPTS